MNENQLAHQEALNEIHKTSNDCDKLFAALAKAQAKIQGAHKDKRNPHFQSKYADLASVWDACREALSENGLCVSQILDFDAHNTILVTILGHVSGQSLTSRMPLVMDKPTAQAMGSALTYARRYALAAIVGVAPEDDDGNAATGSSRKEAPLLKNQPKDYPNDFAPPPAVPPKTTTTPKKTIPSQSRAELQNAILAEMGEIGWSQETLANYCTETYKVRPLAITEANMIELLAEIRKRKA